MIIGGFALPSYGAIRTTVDLDLAVRVQTPLDFQTFLVMAEQSGFKPSAASFSDPVVILTDEKTGMEIELWLRPDGIEWDGETLERRKQVRMGSSDVYIVSPEDFMVSKLARPDRGVQDEKDVKSVLVRMGGSIDTEYLGRRAKKAGVLAILRQIERV
jgi:predicted nucleotidyltransferase